MRLKFTLFLVFVSTLLNAQEVMNAVAGIKIHEPDPVIPLRRSSFIPPTPPLYVIDGILVDSATLRTINPNDILEIYVLQEAALSHTFCRPSRAVVLITTKSSRMLEFTIKNEFTSEAIPFAYVTFISVDSKVDSIMLIADENGRISTHQIEVNKKYKVRISSVGFNTLETDYGINRIEPTEFKLYRNTSTTLSNLIIATICGPRSHSRHGKVKVQKFQSITDSLSANNISIKFFPNPVSPGSKLNFEWQTHTDIKMSIQILSLEGKIVSTQNLTAYKGFNRVSFQTENHWSSGVYFIRVIDDKGKSIQQEKFLLQ